MAKDKQVWSAVPMDIRRMGDEVTIQPVDGRNRLPVMTEVTIDAQGMARGWYGDEPSNLVMVELGCVGAGYEVVGWDDRRVVFRRK